MYLTCKVCFHMCLIYKTFFIICLISKTCFHWLLVFICCFITIRSWLSECVQSSYLLTKIFQCLVNYAIRLIWHYPLWYMQRGAWHLLQSRTPFSLQSAIKKQFCNFTDENNKSNLRKHASKHPNSQCQGVAPFNVWRPPHMICRSYQDTVLSEKLIPKSLAFTVGLRAGNEG